MVYTAVDKRQQQPWPMAEESDVTQPLELLAKFYNAVDLRSKALQQRACALEQEANDATHRWAAAGAKSQFCRWVS